MLPNSCPAKRGEVARRVSAVTEGASGRDNGVQDFATDRMARRDALRLHSRGPSPTSAGFVEPPGPWHARAVHSAIP